MVNSFRKIRKDMFKKKSFLSYMLYAIGEIALIVVGILLALYLQNRNEEKKIAETVKTSISILKDEILTNQEIIDRVRDYHIMIKDTLKNFKTSDNEEDMDLNFWRGMQTHRLQNAGFQTTIQSGVSKEFNQQLLKALNKLYTHQESYNEYTSKSTQIFLNSDITDTSQFGRIAASVRMTMNDIYWYEKELTEMFHYNLKQIDSLYPKTK